MASAPMTRGSVRQGGKEELRASVLKTYLLRLRKERGDRAARQLLASAGIDASVVDNETGWVSSVAAKRALRGVADIFGEEALRKRGDWVIHPEALGTLVRMLRTAEQPIDAYRYLAENARETTRIGSWAIEERSSQRKPVPAKTTPEEPAAEGASAVREGAEGPKSRVLAAKAATFGVKMTYRPRDEEGEGIDRNDLPGEALLCAAREGELASYPRVWGRPDAEITHPQCIARGDDTCVYEVRWAKTKANTGPLLGAAAAGVTVGAAVGAAGGAIAGGLATILAAGLGGGAGYLWDRSKEEKSTRALERNRIAALERGLELRGQLGATPGDLTGTVLGGKYRIGRRIGSGGIGVVYAAEHTSLGHEVAVKVLRGAAARDGGEIARLRREAYIQVHVEHPNVVRVLDLDQMPDGSMYVVMERLIGRALSDKLARDGLLAPGFAIPVFIGVCRALAAAHKKGVVHRDLKPGNIFLCEDGMSKVLDFGMSKLASAEALTQEGYTLGTPEYMAPEQCIGANVEARTDLYALGVLMYEALTGELPIIAASRRELLDLHQRQVPTPMRERRHDLPIPEELDQVVMRCLKKRIQDRPRSAAELEQMLSAIPIQGLPMSYAPGVSRRAPSRKPSSPNDPSESAITDGAAADGSQASHRRHDAASGTSEEVHTSPEVHAMPVTSGTSRDRPRGA